MSSYQTIVADPPWPYDQPDVAGSRQPKVDGELADGVSSKRRYGVMTIKDLCALPVQLITAENAHLYLWTTNAFMVEAHEIARAWGFKPKTIITWGKIKDDGSASMKTGYYFRGATEHILFAVKGSLRLSGNAAPTLFMSPRLPHSQKPPWFYRLVESQSPSPYLELFARPVTPMFQKMPNWSTWGNEIVSDIELATSASAHSSAAATTAGVST